MSERQSNEGCDCGQPLPCSYHTLTDAMRIAYHALRRLDRLQRGRVLCWFCRDCDAYIGPGEAHQCPE